MPAELGADIEKWGGMSGFIPDALIFPTYMQVIPERVTSTLNSISGKLRGKKAAVNGSQVLSRTEGSRKQV
jgi:hypothetical protein